MRTRPGRLRIPRKMTCMLLEGKRNTPFDGSLAGREWRPPRKRRRRRTRSREEGESEDAGEASCTYVIDLASYENAGRGGGGIRRDSRIREKLRRSLALALTNRLRG